MVHPAGGRGIVRPDQPAFTAGQPGGGSRVDRRPLGGLHLDRCRVNRARDDGKPAGNARELLRENEIIRGILAKHTGQDEERIRKDFDRDFFMDPDQAKEYGLIDEVLANPMAVKSEGSNGDGS